MLMILQTDFERYFNDKITNENGQMATEAQPHKYLLRKFIINERMFLMGCNRFQSQHQFEGPSYHQFEGIFHLDIYI